MANVKISDLPAATSLATTDIFPLVQGGITKQATFSLLPFTPSGAGAVSTDLQSRGRLIVYAWDYMSAAQRADVTGFIGSIDVSSAVATALAAVADSGELIFPYGKYKLSSAVNFNGRQNLLVSGPGTIAPDAGVEAFVVNDSASASSQFVTFRSLRFTGTSTSTAISVKNTNANNVLGTFIENCTFTTLQYGVRSTNGSGNIHEIYVRGCYFTNTDIAGSIGVNFDSGDNLISDCVMRGFDKGIRIDRGAVRIIGNHIYREPSAATVCDIEIGFTGQHVCPQTAIIGNYFDGQPTTAQLLLDAFYARNTTVIGNVFLNTAAAGPCVLFDANTAATNIKDFVVKSNVFSANAAKSNTIAFNANAVTTATTGVYIDDNTWDLQVCTPFSFRSDRYSASAATTTSTSDTSLKSFTLPASAMSVNGNLLRIRYVGKAATQDAVPLLKFGATTLANPTVTAGNSFAIDVYLLRTGTATQTATVAINNNGTMSISTPTAAETMANAIVVDFRGSVTAGGTLQLNGATVELLT